MTAVLTPGTQFPPVVFDCVKAAVESTLGSILGTPPSYSGDSSLDLSCDGVIGIISFIGEMPWTFTVVLPHHTAPVLIGKFVGFEIPFDSPDMGDAVGELANVIAGEIVARLDSKRIKAQMSLPMVARGVVELLVPGGLPSARMGFTSTEGPLWFNLAAAKPGNLVGRRPGT